MIKKERNRVDFYYSFPNKYVISYGVNDRLKID